MEKTWKEAASVGTARRTLNLSPEESEIDNLRENLAKGQNERRILAGAGLAAFQKMAGWLPAEHKSALMMTDSLRPNRPYHEANLQSLALIHQGYNTPVFPEWLHWAALSKSSMPLEALPLLLDLGFQFVHCRELAKRMVGARGRWLVRHGGNPHWSWMGQIEAGKGPRLGKQKKQEERVKALFKPGTFYQLGALVRDEMRLLLHPWSLHFSQSVLQALTGVMRQNRHLTSVDQIDLINLAKYRIHPHLRVELAQAFESYSQDSEVLRMVAAMERILNFRQELREGFGILE
jgi:hypothetical protein